MLNKYYWPIVSIAICHLLLVTLGAANVDLREIPKLGPFLSIYGSISGCNDGYGFFAPGIFEQFRARFEFQDRGGKKQVAFLETGTSHEEALRVGDIIDQLRNDDLDLDPIVIQRALSASLAKTIFRRYPEARVVTVYLDRFEPVSIDDYRQGLRPQWDSFYSIKFIHLGKIILSKGEIR